MNKTLGQIYDEYRDEMKKTLGLEERIPHMFSNTRFVERYQQRINHLDILISLYWDLLLSRKSEPVEVEEEKDLLKWPPLSDEGRPWN